MKTDQDRSFEGLIASLLIHGALVLIFLFSPQQSTWEPALPIEIQVVEKESREDLPTQTFVKDPEVGEVIQDLKDKADFLSQFTRRVKEQVRARRIDESQNRKPSISASPSFPQPPPSPGPGEVKTHQEQPFARQVVIGDSTVGERIPGVQEGGFTALNTDQFTYYTFFNRVNQQIRFRWITNIRTFVSLLTAARLKELSATNRTTHVEIILNSTGYFMESVVHRSSGDSDLDLAAIEAFKEASPFLNPPQGLVGSDGYIRLYYSFYVQWRP